MGETPNAPNATRLLAIQCARSGRNVVLCDTTGQLEKEIKEESSTHSSGFIVENISENISVMRGAMKFFYIKKFSCNHQRFD